MFWSLWESLIKQKTDSFHGIWYNALSSDIICSLSAQCLTTSLWVRRLVRTWQLVWGWRVVTLCSQYNPEWRVVYILLRCTCDDLDRKSEPNHSKKNQKIVFNERICVHYTNEAAQERNGAFLRIQKIPPDTQAKDCCILICCTGTVVRI